MPTLLPTTQLKPCCAMQGRLLGQWKTVGVNAAFAGGQARCLAGFFIFRKQ